MQSIADAMNQNVDGAGGEVVAVVELSPEQLEALRERQAEEERKRLARLDEFGVSLAKTRSDAISARQQSGIEDDWLEDEEHYQGIDAANRGEFRSTWRRKPVAQSSEQSTAEKTTRSTVFPNITRPYCDAASARIADMLLPTDDRSWAIRPTPVPDLVSISKGEYPQRMITSLEQQGAERGDPNYAKNQLAAATKAALELIAEAKQRSDNAQLRISDWHVECQWHSHVRQVIEDSARIGTGVLKGPVPVRRVKNAWKNGAFIRREQVSPTSRRIDPWNFFPDGACGENIHNGSFVWERDYLTRKQLRALAEQDDYIGRQIELCLTEGPTRAVAQYKETPDMRVSLEAEKDKFEVWYFHGTAEREDLEVAGCDCEGEEDPHLNCMVVMVNNRVIKASLSALETGEFPYDVMVWQRRSGFWAGIGVARQVRTPQRIVTAATRNLMDNAGIAAGPMIVFRQGVVYPADGKAVGIAPRRVYYIQADASEMIDATKAIGVVKVDMLVNELMEIIQLGLKLAEDCTGLPMLLQGQQGSAPDTLGGLQMMNNNASAVLRRLARLFDDLITEPHVRRYYDYLLMYGEENEKGDFSIDARGSSALVERDLQNQAIAQVGQMMLDPRFGKDPKKWMDEFLKSQRLDVERFNYDDEQWQQIVENMAKGPQDPRMAIAQMNAEFKQRSDQLQMAFEARERERDRQLEFILEEMKTGTVKEESLNKIKAMLSKTVMDNNLQRELTVVTEQARQVAEPPVEPRGRAPNGQAYQK